MDRSRLPATGVAMDRVENLMRLDDNAEDLLRRTLLERMDATFQRIYEMQMRVVLGYAQIEPPSLTVESGEHSLESRKPSREARFDALRAEGKKLGEINAILEAEGFSEVSGEGVMPCPTKSHEIVRENKGAKKMIASLE